MQIPDVNVLVGAYRTDAVDHGRFRAWLVSATGGPDLLGISDIVLSGFIRIVTSPRVFDPPTPITEALSFANALRSGDDCVVVQSGARHWDIFDRLCKESGARGKLVPDAYFAALAIQLGAEWITMDGDYARFPGLKWRRPF
jgi:toxin-antitoxin system PIN domain toxin